MKLLKWFAIIHKIAGENMEKVLFVLGATDLEMKAIEKLLSKNNVAYKYATELDGNLLKPANAYSAFLHLDADEQNKYDTFVLVECKLHELSAENYHNIEMVYIDHHFNGKEVSSIHQLSEYLGIELTHDEHVIGISDHNMNDAYDKYPEDIYRIRKQEFRINDEVESSCKNYIANSEKIADGLYFNPELSPNNFVADLLMLDKSAMIIGIPSDNPDKNKFTLVGYKTQQAYENTVKFYSEVLGTDDVVLMPHRLIAIAYK